MMSRRLIGMIVISVSGLLMVPPLLVASAPVMAHYFFRDSYQIALETGAVQELSVMAILGAGGMVAAIWLLIGSRPPQR
jgi:hypothetical protein